MAAAAIDIARVMTMKSFQNFQVRTAEKMPLLPIT